MCTHFHNYYEIYFSHQKDERPFNRGAMKNIGFIALARKYPNDYKNITYVFNDVDTLPYTKNLLPYETTHGVVKHFYGFTFALAKEVATRNITVNTITPGYIHTDTVAALSDKQKDTIMTWIPMQRFGEVDDIASMVGFLASQKAKYVTGQVISVDGGMAI
mgnify:CR=1 FL=1